MEYRYIIFDFDGVLAESNDIRIQGFADLFEDLLPEQKSRFMEYVEVNGGISRYGKIRYLYETILERSISEDEVNALARAYSGLVTDRIIAAESVPGSREFLAEHADRFEYAVVSGSDQNELRHVCRQRGIDGYFRAILGSPTEKRENLVALLADRNWDRQACLYVGDSVNDYDAARAVGLAFIGRNSGLADWAQQGQVCIGDLTELPRAIEEMGRQAEGLGTSAEGA
jgi:HAD superfamily hydrolase (TIGR01549 family)